MTDGKATYVIIACSRHGKMHRTVTNLRPRPSLVKTNCLARINVVINADSSCVISKIVLEHNHILSPYKSQFFPCNRVIDPNIKRRLDLNDRAGIRLNKNFNSIAVEAGGYENLTFGEKDAHVYTIAKFREFQAELKELMHCETSLLSSKGNAYSYQVNEYGVGGKDTAFTVYFDEGGSLVSCICRLFEYKGIVCRHSIVVLVYRKLMIVPNSYILTRWRKDVRRRYTRVKTWHKNLGSTAEIYRYEVVCSNMYDIADIAAESDEKCEVALRTLRDLKTKLEYTSSSKGSNDIEYSLIAATPSNGASDDRSNDRRVLSPLPVRSKGRPPSKRKESMTDK
ncbi:Protein FAR-RED IMPAIRED RESPONSE 1, partial [Ananas comosus]